MSDYTQVLEHLLNTPLLAHEDKALTVAGVVLGRHGVEVNVAVDASVVNQPKAGPLQEEVLRRRYEMDGGKPFLFAPVLGVAVIEITGSLSHRQWRIGKSSGVMGYDGIGAQLDAALRDPEVRAIALDVHSAGGEVAGAFQLADRIFAARDLKPIVAIADEMAFSAAYLLSAAAGEVWLASEVAQVGSIGAVVVHMSFEEMIRNEGVKVTVIRSAPQKAEGNPYEDLSAPALARVQARIEAVAAPFVARMAAWRGLTEQAIRATEAGTFMGRGAVAAGLADGIADPIDIILALAQSAGAPVPASRQATAKELDMSFTLKNFLGGRSPDLAAAAAAVADAEAGAPDATAVAGVSDADAAAVAAPAAAAAGETDAAAASPPPSTAPADPGAVAEACALAGVANLARPLIDAKLPMTAVQDRIKAAGDIRAAVGLAAKACPTIDPALADQFIANGASAEHVKTKLFDMMSAAQSPEIHAGTPPVDGADPAALQAGWDRAREKVAGTSAAASGGWDTARRTVAGR